MEIMPADHELQLMLVNTLRKVECWDSRAISISLSRFEKDLESSAIPRICLALDTLISSATRDVIPAVQTRLRDLLLHNSSVCILDNWIVPLRLPCLSHQLPRPHIRRRAILAFRALARHDLDLLKWISPKFEKRLHDSHTAVLTASLMISTDIVNVSVPLISLVGSPYWCRRILHTVMLFAVETPKFFSQRGQMTTIHRRNRFSSAPSGHSEC